ncbi:MAG: Hpt domain-containing protein, partial [Campylobacterales bacterium]|nr:Hpt domain-containing protein [Campylobacterales bacterium]
QKDQDIAIVALSANAMKEDVERSHEVGMNSHLNKPIEVEKLYTTLLSYLSPKSDVSILSTSNQAEITIPPLDTIDTNIGNSYLAGNQKLYLKLLHDFKKDYQDFDIKTLDKESYKLKIHTLKGFSGSIGATKLYEICKKLEESQEEQYIEAFAKELQSILSELNDKLPNQPHNDNSANEPISETLKTELLNELKNTLELMEPQKCYTIIQKIEHYQLHSEDEKHFNRIKELIENYQFDEALELFENTKDDN